MPKRIIDGEAVWTSNKLERIPQRFRSEYAWILPLAQANGCFECSPKLVWSKCYSGIREDWTKDDVAKMLDEFGKAKLLFRWKVGENTFGFFIGAQKEGRLPPPSLREKTAKQWQHGMMPVKQLADFLGLTVKEIERDYHDLLLTNSRVGRDKSKSKSTTGIGIGTGVGSGVGVGKGTGYGIGVGVGNESSGGAASLQHSNTCSTELSITNNTSTQQHGNTTTPTRSDINSFLDKENSLEDVFDDEPDELEYSTPVKSKLSTDPLDNLTPLGFAFIFRNLMKVNPHASVPPKGWDKMWEDDFKKLVDSGLSDLDILDIIAISQLEKNQQFYVRASKLVENLKLLEDMVNERAKAMPVIRSEFRKTLKQICN